MKNLNRGRSLALGLALVAATLAAPPAVSASAAPASRPDPTIVEEMRQTASGAVAVRANPATGEVGFVRAKERRGDLLPEVAADNRSGAVAKADAYIEQFAAAFGATPGQLRRAEVFADRYGWSVTYTQSYRGVPVFGAELKAHVDKAGQLTSINGYAAPDLDLGVSPTFSRRQAADRALAMVAEQPAGHEGRTPAGFTQGLKVRSNQLTVYRTGSTRGIDGSARLAWVLEVWNRSTVRETVVLDARTGKALNRWSMIAHALDRELYEGAYDPASLVWSEGDGFPGTLDVDQQNEVLGTGEAYWMFKNTFGYDAWDGAGGKMITVNNDPRISCPNANWNGVTTNYCTGVTGDDTVAHEWGHAYTESTSGLIYQWQSGAMNEAYSDIWGETVDMLNARHNEGGETPGDAVLREPGKCSIHQASAYALGVTIDAPTEIAGPCESTPGFGPEIEGSQTVQLVVGVDRRGGTDGCNTLTNSADIAGNWVYLDRGTCTFQEKADAAVAAGASGLVVGNNTTGLLTMGGSSTIPAFMITQDRGADIKSVAGPVTMTIQRLEDPRMSDDTYRWLSGESDPAFGGAIRDMWNPNCYGDPGQVSDEEYHCSADDSGGVHTNSGVVNRAFAILVDGLPGTVDAIGLDKAANLFWRAQTNYLTPTSYFPDLADALEQSCVDLTAVPINEVTLGSPTRADGADGAATPEQIAGGMTASDCAAVTAAIAETELRLDPTAQCAWEPLLQPGAPTLDCGAGTVTEVAYSEAFEDGLAGWTQDEEMPYADTETLPWEARSDAPDHPGGVAYAPDPTSGSCGLDADDISSRSGLITPDITVPAGISPRLSFDHYVATESGWDGGNVKVSVNGRAFNLVPSSAYLFNGPRGTLETEAAGNTSPMAGEPAWTGTDGGVLAGSWGTTVVDLGAIAAAGDTVAFRFDMGRDGCNGVDGWYVDNVTVASCVDAADAQPTTTEVTSVTPRRIAPNTPFTVNVEVSAVDIPTGEVEVVKSGTVLATGALDANGVAHVEVTDGLPAGRHKLVVRYTGADGFAPSRDTVAVRVARQ